MKLNLTNNPRNIAAVSGLLIFILILIAFLVFQGTKIGGKDSLNTSYPVSTYLQPHVKDTDSYPNPVRINGDATGIALGSNVEFQQETLKIPEGSGCIADEGFEMVYLPELNMPSFRMYLINKDKVDTAKFNEYYNKFSNFQYKEGDSQFILYPFCGHSRYIDLDSYSSSKINITNKVNIALGGYQSVPNESDDVTLSAAAFAFNADNMVQINFTIPNLFKFNEVENFESCKPSSELAANEIINTECFSEVLKKNSQKMDIVKAKVDEILSKVNLQFY